MALPAAPAYTGSKSQSSQGSYIYVNPTNASPPEWVPIGEPLKMVFNDKNVFDDATNLQSQAKEFLATLPDPGKLEVDLNRVSTDAGQAALQASKSASPPTKLPYLVVLPLNGPAGQTTTPDSATFEAFVESLHPEINADKKIISRFSLQISGPITWTEGS